MFTLHAVAMAMVLSTLALGIVLYRGATKLEKEIEDEKQKPDNQ